MSGFRIVLRDNLFMNTAEIYIEDERNRAVLTKDGTWRTFEPGALMEPNTLPEIPRAAVEHLAQAIAEYQGHASHADTEARVLREWLAVEQRRVDEALRK